ncbi:uncharacterized protein LY89DRAFT_788444 [Mollisia scopiformis]|uniref:F-box domain-containing protein n=1 Tax=Mollisia scopiformis TaxID=149040 RepID=A0A132BAK9_MOLSC|nr:uncharacterized protein LY89DRAFT_788444 [Mollisia scopiformis]KUJ09029.1 hypothetical protein LY89DRAFT_788444 [Mollisia scopiformis]
MSITHLSTELLQKIYDYSDLQDLLSVARTSRRTYRVFLGRRMHHYEQGLHNSYSPLPSLLKLVLSNEPDKSRKPIGMEIRINMILGRIIQAGDKPKLTLEHMKKMVEYGKIADRWTELYPRLRWRFGSDNRRLLHPHEKERLRRAIYHHWTYTTLFHSRVFTQYSPDPPSPASHDDPRHRLLRTYSTVEHVQLSEFLAHVEQLVELDLYPSNSIVQDHYSHSLPPRALAKIAWGEGNEYRRLVRDIMKLSPADLLHLVENTTTKTERLDFLYAKEACFGDVPATLNYALSTVSVERARHCWGLEGPALKMLVPSLQFASLRPSLPEPESDFGDDNLVFGIVDVVAREKLEVLEAHIACDAVETGEWDKYCGQIGLAPSAVVVEETNDEV